MLRKHVMYIIIFRSSSPISRQAQRAPEWAQQVNVHCSCSCVISCFASDHGVTVQVDLLPHKRKWKFSSRESVRENKHTSENSTNIPYYFGKREILRKQDFREVSLGRWQSVWVRLKTVISKSSFGRGRRVRREADTLAGGGGFLPKGSEDPNGSFLSVFLKKSSDEVPLKGSFSLNGSPPNGSWEKERTKVRYQRTFYFWTKKNIYKDPSEGQDEDWDYKDWQGVWTLTSDLPCHYVLRDGSLLNYANKCKVAFCLILCFILFNKLLGIAFIFLQNMWYLY